MLTTLPYKKTDCFILQDKVMFATVSGKALNDMSLLMLETK